MIDIKIFIVGKSSKNILIVLKVKNIKNFIRRCIFQFNTIDSNIKHSGVDFMKIGKRGKVIDKIILNELVLDFDWLR